MAKRRNNDGLNKVMDALAFHRKVMESVGKGESAVWKELLAQAGLTETPEVWKELQAGVFDSLANRIADIEIERRAAIRRRRG